MWELDHKESWALKNWCFRNAVLEKTLESPLDNKEIQTVHPKGNQSWKFIGRTDAEAETPILWPLDAKNWLIWKDPDAGTDWRREEKGMTEDEMVRWHHRLNGHGFGWTPGVGDGQGGLACCSSWVSKSWAWLSDWIELNQVCVSFLNIFLQSVWSSHSLDWNLLVSVGFCLFARFVVYCFKLLCLALSFARLDTLHSHQFSATALASCHSWYIILLSASMILLNLFFIVSFFTFQLFICIMFI